RFSMLGAPDGARLDLDADGDGVIDFSGDRLDDETFVFTTPGLYVATVTVTDAAGARSTSQATVEVLDLTALDAVLQAKWSGMKDALRIGDIPKALSFIAERRQADYDAAFGALMAQLPGVDTYLTDIAVESVSNAAAIYEMTRVDDGILKSFPVRFAV